MPWVPTTTTTTTTIAMAKASKRKIRFITSGCRKNCQHLSTFFNARRRVCPALRSGTSRNSSSNTQQQQQAATTGRGAAIVLAITKPKYASGQEQQQQDQCPFKSRCRRWKQRRTRGALSVQRAFWLISASVKRPTTATTTMLSGCSNNSTVSWLRRFLWQERARGECKGESESVDCEKWSRWQQKFTRENEN